MVHASMGGGGHFVGANLGGWCAHFVGAHLISRVDTSVAGAHISWVHTSGVVRTFRRCTDLYPSAACHASKEN